MSQVVVPVAQIASNQSLKKNNNEKGLFNIVKYIKHKFPSFILFIHISVAKYVFTCKNNPISAYNSTDVVNQYILEHGNMSKNIFWTYIVIMGIICFTWEFVYKYYRYKRKNKKFHRNAICYAVLSSFLALLAFVSTIFYMDDSNVFNCFIDYDDALATFCFFMSYGIIFAISSLEHYCFKID